MENNSKKSKTLFIDDDTFMLDLMSRKFKEAGLDTDTLENANGDFVEKTIEIAPDLIFLDIVMPGLDGFKAITLLKDNPKTKDIPVIFCSNLQQAKDIHKGIELGALDYLVTSYLTPSEVVKIAIDYLNDPKNYIKRYPSFIEKISAKSGNYPLISLEKFNAIIIYSIAVLSGIWLFSTFLEGVPSMAHYLDGDPESALIVSFVALFGLFAPKVYFENLKEKQAKKEIEDISKKYFKK